MGEERLAKALRIAASTFVSDTEKNISNIYSATYRIKNVHEI
jgi:hypothetical protein